MTKSSQSISAKPAFCVVPMPVTPLRSDLNNGYSLGLDYPLIWGFRTDRKCWMLWNRHTGDVFAYVPGVYPRWQAERILEGIAELQTIGVPFNPAVLDAVP